MNLEQLKQLKEQRRQDYLQRIPIEGLFGRGKNGYQLNYIRAKRANTSFAWINSIFLVMSLMVLQRIFFVISKMGIAGWVVLLKRLWKLPRVNDQLNFFLPDARLDIYAY